MKSVIGRATLGAALAGLAACATGTQPSQPDAVAGPKSPPGDVAAAGALPDAALPKGTCGMILWTLDVERPTPVFRAIAEKGGEVHVDGALRTLALTGVSGGAGFGVFETQTFAGEGLTVTVKARFGLGFEGGTYLERGLISIEKADGWKTVIPAAGIAGCRSN